MIITTNIRASGLIDQLADELVTSYSADTLTITQIVTALLAFQVLTPPITVGTIDPTVERSVDFAGDTILRALYRLRDTVGGYIYVDANRALQWRTTIGEDKGQQIRYRKNLNGITRETDYTTLKNKLYAYGEGEGDARIKLSDADGQDEDYVEDTDSQTEWGGTYTATIVDKSITHPDTLLAWANLRLEDLKDPRRTYEINVVDLSASDEFDFSFEALQIGSIITVIDEELGIDISAQVVRITHPDLMHPEQMVIEVSNKTINITDALAVIYDTQQLEQHIATRIGAGQVVVLGSFTVIDWATEGLTTIDGGNIETGTITADLLDANVLIAENIIVSGAIRLSDWRKDGDLEKFDGAKVSTGTLSKTGLNFSAFEKDVDTLDDMADGTTYSRVNTIDITAGSINLSSVIQTSNYRTVTDGNTSSWDGKPENMDQIGEGGTYGRVAQTIIAAGLIQVGTGTKGSTLNGFHISATEIVGQLDGDTQVSMGTDGKIHAGADNAVIIDSTGIVTKGAIFQIHDSNDVLRGLLGHNQMRPAVELSSVDDLYISAADDIYLEATGIHILGDLYIPAIA